MKFLIRSYGLHDYRSDCLNDLENLGFKFKQTDKIRTGPLFWCTKIEEPKMPIEINSLEALIDFINRHGDCIISEGLLTINDPDDS